jgi:glycosyltransferase involved in cell wall biosynthesis
MRQLTAELSREHHPEVVECPLATVVIVCFNQARYLSEAIESALKQTYPSLEILVVDDGSTDDTATVAQAYPSIRYVRQSNRGLSAARNTGLRCSRGEYVAFLDADDKLLPNAIQAGSDCFRESPGAAFVYGAFRNVLSDGSLGPSSDSRPVEKDHYRHLLEGNFIGMHGTVLYQRSALLASGGFDESLQACEDYDLYLRIARDTPVRGHSGLVAEYRQHDANMSRDHAFMLKHVLKVLDRERLRLPSPSYRGAVRTGVRVWKEYYGALLLEKWKQSPNLPGLFQLFRFWPRGVWQQGARALLRGASARFRKGPINFGSFQRCTPISRQFGFDRGMPVDRYYIEKFLEDHANGIRGRVLEVGDDAYSRRFGGGAVTQQDILHVVPGFPTATIVADLAAAPHIPSQSFDCVILTQTLHYIFDLQGAAATLHRILKPGGVALITLPGVSRICRDQEDTESDCWRFTTASGRKLFARPFGPDNIDVRAYGNVKTAVAFLEGLAAKDLTKADLEKHDPDYQVVIAVTARKRKEG